MFADPVLPALVAVAVTVLVVRVWKMIFQR